MDELNNIHPALLCHNTYCQTKRSKFNKNKTQENIFVYKKYWYIHVWHVLIIDKIAHILEIFELTI